MTHFIYSDLDRELRLQIDSGKKSLRNLLTALNLIVEVAGEEACTELLAQDGTENLRDRLTEHLRTIRKPDSTVRSVRSNTLKLSILARQLFNCTDSEETSAPVDMPDFSEMSFKEAVRAAVDAYYKDRPAGLGSKGNFSIKAAVADIAKRSNGNITYEWIADMAMRKRRLKQVHPKTPARVELLERFLGLNSGYLACRLPLSRNVAYSEKKFEHADRYALKELPAQVEAQWKRLKEFWSHGDLPTIPPSFADDPALSVRLSGGESWEVRIVDGAIVTRTALTAHARFRAFFGWLYNECDVELDEMHLSMLGYDALLDQYKSFVRKRGNGLSMVAQLYQLVQKLYKEPYSYGSRYHAPKPFTHDSDVIRAAYPAGLPEYQSGVAWSESRIIVAGNLKVAQHELKRSIGRQKRSGESKNTGGSSNIQWLRDASEGIVEAVDKHLFGMINTMISWSQDVPRHGEHYAARYAASAAFYAMSFVRPLRVNNVLLMKILDRPCRNTSRLIQESMWVSENGDFCFFSPRVSLKNRSGNEIEAVEFIVFKDDPVHAVIENWLTHRAALLLENKVESDRLFIKTSVGYVGNKLMYTNDEGETTSTDSEIFDSDSLLGLLEYFGPEQAEERMIENGINPHAMRHIVALYNLEVTGYDYPYVAHLLMDSVDMIIKTYGKNNHAQQSMKAAKMQRQRIARLKAA